VSGFGYASTLGICSTSYQYDPDGNVVLVNWPTQTSSDRNPVTTYAYTNTNLVLTETDPNPAVGGTVTAETYSYDAEGKQIEQTDANGISTQTTYTADELVAATTKTPNGTTTHITSYLYDANGDQVELLDAVGDTTLTTYFPNGLTQSVTDGMGDETSYVYDAVGNPTEIVSPDANVKATANPNGTPTYNFYTEDNLLQATLIPINATDTQRGVCYSYDQSGRKTGQGSLLNTGAVMTTVPTACVGGLPSASFGFTNSPDGRLAKETGRDGMSTLSFTYDADGNQLTSVSSISGSTITTTDTYYADDLLRTAQDMTSNYRVTDYAYDGAGHVTGRNSVPSSGTTYKDTLTYNDAGLEASETNSISTGTTTWSYDVGGRPFQLTDGEGDQTTYYYAADGTLDDEAAYENGGLGLSGFSQTLDGDYRVTSDGCGWCSNTTGGNVGHTFTYQYDAAGRLIFIDASGGSAAFQTYDPDGNRITHDDVVTDVTTTYTYNADNSIATSIVSGTTLNATYDTHGAGVLTSDGCEQWTLDTFDRASALAPVSSPPSVCATTPSTTYTHDANGTMLTETTSGTTTTIHNDPISSTPIVENVGSTTTAYVLDSIGNPMVAAQGSTVDYLVDDPKGDLSTMMGPSSIYPTCEIQYDPYGTVVFGQSPSNHCESGSTFVDLLYQNQRIDSSSGDYQLGSRTYDPSKNSFLSPDHYQLGTSDQDLSIQVDPLTENAYTFVDGDPVSLFDPSGHMFTTGCEDDPSGCTPAQKACDDCRVYPTSGNHGHGPGGCGNCAKAGPPVPKPHAPNSTSASQSSSTGPFSYQDPNYGGAVSAGYGFTVPELQGAGILQLSWFIQGNETCAVVIWGCLAGDSRSFDASAQTSQNRATAWIDLDTGQGQVILNPSCQPAHVTCTSAYPVTFGSGNGTGSENDFSINAAFVHGQEVLQLATNFHESAASFPFGIKPGIADSITFVVNTSGAVSGMESDGGFPSLEIYHRSASDLEEVQTLFQRSQTVEGGIALSAPGSETSLFGG
jgi:RHS repeat-associated protein